jgi:hypothetical protein
MMRVIDRVRRLLRALKPDPLESDDGRLTAEWLAFTGLRRVLGSDMVSDRNRREDARRPR